MLKYLLHLNFIYYKQDCEPQPSPTSMDVQITKKRSAESNFDGEVARKKLKSMLLSKNLITISTSIYIYIYIYIYMLIFLALRILLQDDNRTLIICIVTQQYGFLRFRSSFRQLSSQKAYWNGDPLFINNSCTCCIDKQSIGRSSRGIYFHINYSLKILNTFIISFMLFYCSESYIDFIN